jgi:two-component system cell cycle sensor histidine kinase/response regulator CckA
MARTVLVVDDETPLRRFLQACLKYGGYDVIEAGSADEAVRLVQAHSGAIVLAVLDILLPGASGLDLSNELLRHRPEVPVLYITGLMDSIAVEGIALRRPQCVLRKPFTATQLMSRVNMLLA